MSDLVDRILVLIDESGLVSAEGQTCGTGVSYAAQPVPAPGSDDRPSPSEQVRAHYEQTDPELVGHESLGVPPGTVVEDEEGFPWCWTGRQWQRGTSWHAPAYPPDRLDHPRFWNDGFTVRRVEEDGTLGEPVAGIQGASLTVEHTDELVDGGDFYEYRIWQRPVTVTITSHIRCRIPQPLPEPVHGGMYPEPA